MSLQSEMSPATADVTKMIAQAREGSRNALGRLLDAYRLRLLRAAHQDLAPFVRAKVDPCDLVQDTFLEAVRDFLGFQGENEWQLLGWLRRILCHNLANVHRRFETDKRRAAREITLEKAAAAGLLHDAVEQSEPSSRQAAAHDPSERLQRAMQRLSQHHRQILLLRAAEEWTFVQIAEMMGSTPDAVRKKYKRAADKLVKFL